MNVLTASESLSYHIWDLNLIGYENRRPHLATLALEGVPSYKDYRDYRKKGTGALTGRHSDTCNQRPVYCVMGFAEDDPVPVPEFRK
jgi:hypothetical protein